MAEGLFRFVAAQEGVYPAALAELKAGRKTSHWMWFVFPQIAGLGRSETARLYAIAGRGEARAYLAHPVLGARLSEAMTAVLAHRGTDAETIFGSVDAMKFRSSMTLFAAAADDPTPFVAVLEAFFDGARDAATLALLAETA